MEEKGRERERESVRATVSPKIIHFDSGTWEQNQDLARRRIRTDSVDFALF